MSLSAKLRMRSRKEGTEPVVRAFTRGMVTVGGVACAVNGMAAPERIRLLGVSGDHSDLVQEMPCCRAPLCVLEPRIVAVDKVTPQGVHHHEDDPVEEWSRRKHGILAGLEGGQTGQDGFVGEEAGCEKEHGDGEQQIGTGQRGRSRA